LLSLYANEADEDQLLNFLGQAQRYYDIKYALSVCTKQKKTRACVLLFGEMGMYHEALDLALTVDIELAKRYIEKTDDVELQKKLWLKIARYHAEVQHDIKSAMSLLSETNLLKIEDILPFFPEFTRIDAFKDEICNSLEDYNKLIGELQQEMDEATESASRIRDDIETLRNRYGTVRANQTCELCSWPILMREFYYFPCKHMFHSDCLKNEVQKHMSNFEKKRIKELTTAIAQTQHQEHPKDLKKKGSESQMGPNEIEKLKVHTALNIPF
jgi:vacuolar protein sorting-associated protein 18